MSPKVIKVMQFRVFIIFYVLKELNMKMGDFICKKYVYKIIMMTNQFYFIDCITTYV